MRIYGTVHTTFWSSATTRAMSEDARLLALYLLTSPHSTIAGAFRLPDGYLCEDLQWNAERVSKGFAELLIKGFANRCETVNWVWVCKHFEWNKPDNPNQRKAALKIARLIPDECSWKQAYMRVSADSLGLTAADSTNGFETAKEPFANQEQEQEQKQSRSSAQRKRGLPADFGVSDAVKEWAASNGHHSLDRHLEKFRSTAKAKGYWYADWDAAFRNCISDNWAKVEAPAAQPDYLRGAI